MKTPWEILVGVNWRTSLIGLLETIVALGAAYALLPDSVRNDPLAITVALCVALLKTLKESQTKDKQVTGTPGTGYIVGTKNTDTRHIAPEGETQKPEGQNPKP